MTESLSQSSVVHITSLWGVSPLAQFNGQLGHYSQFTVSTDVPMAWHMGIHAHAHTLSPGTIHFLRRQRLYKPKNGLMPTFVELACVCRHGNMYVLHGMLDLWVQSSHMLITHKYSLRGSQGESGEWTSSEVSTCLHSVKWANQDTTGLHEP